MCLALGTPPSMRTVEPVMNAAAGDSRNTTAAETSASVPRRCSGTLRASWRIFAWNASGYVSKPLDAGELFKTMESLIAAPCKAAQGAIDEAMQSEAQPESLLDRAAIMASVGGNPALLQGLVKLFLNKYPAMLEEMKKAIVDGDAETLGRVAHKLKGAGGYFLTPSAKEATQRLEMMGKEGNLGGATGDMDLLEQEMSRINPELVALGG